MHNKKKLKKPLKERKHLFSLFYFNPWAICMITGFKFVASFLNFKNIEEIAFYCIRKDFVRSALCLNWQNQREWQWIINLDFNVDENVAMCI